MPLPINVRFIVNASPGEKTYYYARSLDGDPKTAGPWALSHYRSYVEKWLRDNGYIRYGVAADETYTRDAAKAKKESLRSGRDS